MSEATCLYSRLCQKQLVSIPDCVRSNLSLFQTVPKATCLYSRLCLKQLVSIPDCVRSNLFLFQTVSEATCLYSRLCLKQLVSIPDCVRSNLFLFQTLSEATCLHSRLCLTATPTQGPSAKRPGLQRPLTGARHPPSVGLTTAITVSSRLCMSHLYCYIQ